jgi:hypothetical protein
MVGTSKELIKRLVELPDDKKYEIKEYKEKRSINANNYYWQLVTELGNVLGMDKEWLHFLLLQKYGQSEMISVVAEIDMSDYLKYYTEAGESNLNGKTFKHYKVYKGSSEMDKKEMSILINGLVEECKAQDIETKTPAEINSLLERWDNK